MLEATQPEGEQNQEQQVPLHELPPPVRPFWRFLIAAGYLFATNWVAVAIATMLLGRHPIVADAAYRVIALVFAVAGFRFMLRVFDDAQGDLWSAMGLPLRRDALLEVSKGLLIGFSLILFCVAVIASFGRFSVRTHFDASALERLVVITLLLLFGAMLEEVMFRGYPFQRLVDSIGALGAVLVLSAIFGAVHFSNPDNKGFWSWEFFNTLAVGALFAVAYLRTKSLWMPFGMHFGWNYALGVLFGLPVSGIKEFGVIVRGTAVGPRMLTGGGYGIEGSLTGAVAILLGFVPVLYFTRGHLNPEADNFSGSGI